MEASSAVRVKRINVMRLLSLAYVTSDRVQFLLGKCFITLSMAIRNAARRSASFER